jgi:hypothetical protein
VNVFFCMGVNDLMRFLNSGLGFVLISLQRLRNMEFGVFMIFCFLIVYFFLFLCFFFLLRLFFFLFF